MTLNYPLKVNHAWLFYLYLLGIFFACGFSSLFFGQALYPIYFSPIFILFMLLNTKWIYSNRNYQIGIFIITCFIILFIAQGIFLNSIENVNYLFFLINYVFPLAAISIYKDLIFQMALEISTRRDLIMPWSIIYILYFLCFIAQKYWLFPFDGTIIYIHLGGDYSTALEPYDKWSGFFPLGSDYLLAFWSNFTFLFFLNTLKSSTNTLIKMYLILIISACIFTIYSGYSNINKAINVFFIFYFLYHINTLRTILSVILILITPVLLTIFYENISTFFSKLLVNADLQKNAFIDGLYNSRIGGIGYILSGESTLLGNGAGVNTIYGIDIGKGRTAITRGLPFSVLYEVGIIGVALYFIGLTKIYSGIWNPTFIAIIIHSITHETIKDIPILILSLICGKILHIQMKNTNEIHSNTGHALPSTNDSRKMNK